MDLVKLESSRKLASKLSFEELEMCKFTAESKKTATEEPSLAKASFPSRLGLAAILGASLFIADKVILSDLKTDMQQAAIKTIFGVQVQKGDNDVDFDDIKDLVEKLGAALPVAALIIGSSMMLKRKAEKSAVGVAS